MSNEYPLYPSLPEDGEKEAQALIDRFKEDLKKAANEVIGDFYCDVATHIESDSWTNYRNAIMDGFKNYNTRKVQAKYDFKQIRAEIYKEFREDIIKDLNQDIFEENARLEERILILQGQLYDRH